jgi:hypothetical protein
MIDYFMRFTDEAEAISEAVAYGKLGSYDNSSPPIWRWNTDHVLPNCKAWRVSQDVIVGSPPSVVHSYITGWLCIVALHGINQTLLNHPKMSFALNRDGPPYVIRNTIGTIIQDIAAEPIFAGSHYPLGDIGTGSPDEGVGSPDI